MNFILASNNSGKCEEMLEILRPFGIELTTVRDAGFSSIDPEETGTSFAENAEIKARAFCEHTGMPVIADDSGLCVDALGGAPGVYSARYGGDHNFNSGIDLLLHELKEVPAEKRTARFVCSICCIWPDGRKVTAEGKVEGSIAFERIGEGGFGFDPVFLLPDGRSFAAISSEEKNAISHRGVALRELVGKLKSSEE